MMERIMVSSRVPSPNTPNYALLDKLDRYLRREQCNPAAEGQPDALQEYDVASVYASPRVGHQSSY